MFRSRTLLIACILSAMVGALGASTARAQVVISQIYGSGGLTGAAYKNDYVELFNRGATAVDLSTWSVQYASVAGFTWTKVNLTGSIAPGGYYLIQGVSGGTVGATLPTPDCLNNLTTDMSGSQGKVALVANQTTLPLQNCFPLGTNGIVDLVGYGASAAAAPCFEGNAGAAAPSAVNATFRLGNGCTDTNSNSRDFTAASAAPRNSGSGTSSCSSPTGACCISSGQCQIMSQSACSAIGGAAYTGDGSVCPAGTYTVTNVPAALDDISTQSPNTVQSNSANNDTTTTVPAANLGNPLPFDFYYFGQLKTNIRINTNGFIIMSPTTEATTTNANLPFPTAMNAGASTVNDIIAPYWDDLEILTTAPTSTGRVYTLVKGTAPNRQFIVQWNGVYTKPTTGTPIAPNTFQAILNETTNVIEFRYGTVTAQGGAVGTTGVASFTSGIEDLSGTVGVDVTAGVGTGGAAAAVQFTPANVCPTPGSCCINFICSLNDLTGCIAAGGIFNATATPCSPDPCSAPTGNCCVAGVCSITVQSGCSGFWTNSGSCSPNPCTAQCCAADGSCTLVVQSACTGTWSSTGASCNPNPCPQPIGTCCSNTDGSCSLLYSGSCASGTFSGAGTTCDASACPSFGVCCTGTACTFAAQATCTSGTWTVGGSCSPNLCAFACCDSATSTCSLVAFGGSCSGISNPAGSTCSTSPCPPPANDLCTGAIALSLGTPVFGNNSSATSDTAATCDGLSVFSAGVWYTYTAAASHRYQVSTCDAGTTFNTRMAVYTTSDCATFNCVHASTSSSPACTASSNAANASSVGFCAAAGTTYYIMVASDSTAAGAFVLTLTDLGDICPPNDVCSGAIPIVLGSSTAGDSSFAENDANPAGVGSCNTLSTFTKGLWYTFTDSSPTPRRLRADLCDPVTDFDAQMYVYSSTNGCAGPMSCVWANATSGIGCPDQGVARWNNSPGVHTDIPSILNWTFTSSPSTEVVTKCTTPQFDGNNNVVPTTYYILVTSQGTAGGHFVLHLVDTGESCNGTPPAHNSCAGARPLTTLPIWDDVYPFDAIDSGPAVSCNSPAGSTGHAGLWYTYTPSASGNFYYTKLPDEGTNDKNDTVITFFTGADCSSLTEAACANAGGGWTTFATQFVNPTHLNAGVTYYIQVGLNNTALAGFSMPQAWNLGFNFVVDPGACCTAGVCSITADAATCTSGGGSYRGTGTTCSPDPCSGICCRGSTCNATVSQADCTATAPVGALFAPSSTGACNTANSTTTPCCYADFNKIGGITVNDIFDFLGAWFAGSPFANVGGDGTSGPLNVQNIFDFLNAWFAGGC
jgi:hypothetical protein